jgi:hypothetical protein
VYTEGASWYIKTMDKSSAPLLTEQERSELKALLGQQCLDNMFGDGLERDYIIEGFPAWKGLANMSDLELLEELGHYDPDVHTTPELIAQAWKDELAEGESGEDKPDETQMIADFYMGVVDDGPLEYRSKSFHELGQLLKVRFEHRDGRFYVSWEDDPESKRRAELVWTEEDGWQPLEEVRY